MLDETLLVAVLDACVLYPPSLRDLFMRLASALVYQPRWTEEIHAEWMRNVLEDRPQITPAQLERTRRLMDQISDESLVSGSEAHVPALSLPDPNDRHVLAAAIQAEAAVIVTFNLSDFPQAALAPFGVRALHPDEYLVALLDDAPELLLLAVREHRAALTRPLKTAEAYLETLRANRLTQLALRLAERRNEIREAANASSFSRTRSMSWEQIFGTAAHRTVPIRPRRWLTLSKQSSPPVTTGGHTATLISWTRSVSSTQPRRNRRRCYPNTDCILCSQSSPKLELLVCATG